MLLLLCIVAFSSSHEKQMIGFQLHQYVTHLLGAVGLHSNTSACMPWPVLG